MMLLRTRRDLLQPITGVHIATIEGDGVSRSLALQFRRQV